MKSSLRLPVHLLVSALTIAVACSGLIAPAAIAVTPQATSTSSTAPSAVVSKRAAWPIFPGSRGPRVREVQQRLKQTGLYAGPTRGFYNAATVDAVRTFQTRKGLPATGNTDRRTFKVLRASTNSPTLRLDRRCLTGRAMCIDKRQRLLSWVVNGKVLKTVQVRFGSSELPTREGSFRVFKKSRDHVSSLYHTSMPFAMFFSGGQAVHYSSDFAARGYSGASHGCVNVRDYGAIKWLFDQVNLGDKVIIYWSKK